MKTVVISGYYGYENTGDEALLASIIQALRNRLPDLRIIVLSAKPAETARRYGVEAADRLSLLAAISALRRADLLISGGGSLLQDVTGPWTIPYYLGIAAIAKMLGKSVMFYAQGIGPVNKGLGRGLVRLIANKVDVITLRDQASADLIRKIGVNRPPVEVTADPVFGLEVPAAGPAEIFRQINMPVPEKPVIGIFIRDWLGFPGYKAAVAGLADSLASKGRQLVFVPMQYPEDAKPAREIAAMMKTEPWIIEKRLSLTQMLGLIKSMDMVVGMRLHALIMAAVCAVPMLGISYDPKVADFLKSIGQPVIEDLNEISAEQLIEETAKVFGGAKVTRVRLTEIQANLRERAQKNADIAVKLIEG